LGLYALTAAARQTIYLTNNAEMRQRIPAGICSRYLHEQQQQQQQPTQILTEVYN